MIFEGDKGEFKEVEDAGMGEGQGSKDVSDQIEDEEQVEDQPGVEPQDQDEEDIPEEENGIEMTEDFEGKMHDGELDQKEEEGSDDERDEKEELDKQMGELGDDEADKLDERMWGSDDEEEDQSESNKEEKGTGVDKEKSELGAKDDEVTDQSQEEENKEQKEDLKEDVKDQSEFDPNERDDDYANEPNELPEPMDLDDNLQLDKDEKGNDNEENNCEQDAMEIEQEDISLPKDAEIENENVEEEKEENGEDDGQDEHPEEEDLPEMTQQAEEEVGEEDDEEIKGEEEGIEQKRENEDKQENDDNKQSDDNENEENKENENNETRNKETQLPIEEEKEENPEFPVENTSRKEIGNTEDEIVQSENANEQVEQQTKEEGKDEEASGTAPSSDQTGVDSSNAMSSNLMDQNKGHDNENKHDKKLGQSDSKRSLADPKETIPKRLKTMETEVEDVTNQEEKRLDRDADFYQHLEDEDASYDKETLDAATEDQQEQQQNKKEENKEDKDAENLEDEQDNDMEDQLTEEQEMVVMATLNEKQPDPEKKSSKIQMEERNNLEEDSFANNDKEEEKDVAMETELVKDLPPSSIHTNVADWNPQLNLMSLTQDEIIKIRKEMEEQLQEVAQNANQIELAESEKLWHEYQSLTQPLSQELSEQLRLILEPTRRSKLKGDYRSGKRLNMRKVIPYIASGFRKDKIWLRRSKPSKREYQIMIAIDDSSSMADNHTKQLAFESLCVISTALSTLEAGQLGVCNFGESAQLLHDFYQPFTDQSGASILQKCLFKQEQTKIAKLLETSVGFMKTSQSNSTSSADPRISQLLLIISDGRGLYVEGKEKVESAVRSAKEAGIFLAFIILDNPACKDSILDIKVPIFEEGKMPQIRSYLADFPFPFYVIIRDTNALPETLSDALRSWFELVTSTE